MSIYDRPLAFTALIPTTNEVWLPATLAEPDAEDMFCLVPNAEICDLALILADPNLAVIDRMSCRLKIQSPQLMTDTMKRLSGYNDDTWRDADDPEFVLMQYLEKTKGAIFASYRADFDLGLLRIYFDKYKLKSDFYEHRLDLLSYTKGYCDAKKIELPSYDLNKIAAHFQITVKSPPFRAYDRANLIYSVYKKLLERQPSYSPKISGHQLRGSCQIYP